MTPLIIGSDRTPIVTTDTYYKFTENTVVLQNQNI